jgi:hypothetical protein
MTDKETAVQGAVDLAQVLQATLANATADWDDDAERRTAIMSALTFVVGFAFALLVPESEWESASKMHAAQVVMGARETMANARKATFQ